MFRRFALLALLVIGFLYWETPIPISDDGSYFLYRPLVAMAPHKVPLDQGAIGTCVAAAHAEGYNIGAAILKAQGKIHKLRFASIESAYGGARNESHGRASRSFADGSNGHEMTRWLNEVGGVLFEQPYDGVDLTDYDIRLAKNWGATGNGGSKDGVNPLGPLDQEAAKNPVKGVAKVTTLDELDAALKHGWPVSICSGQGFNSPRDSDGFCAPRGSWSHCMLIVGKRNEGRKGYLILNSWGQYIKGDGVENSPNKYKDQPDGSFYAEPSVVLRILQRGDSWALSVAGFSDFGEELPQWLLDADALPPENLSQGVWFNSYEDAYLYSQENGCPLVVFFNDEGKSYQSAKAILENELADFGKDYAVAVLDVKNSRSYVLHYGAASYPEIFTHSRGRDLRFGLRGRAFTTIAEEL